MKLIPDQELLLHALHGILEILVHMVSHRQLSVEVHNILANFGPDQLLLHSDGFQHKFLCSAVLLFLARLDRNTLHGASLFFLSILNGR